MTAGKGVGCVIELNPDPVASPRLDRFGMLMAPAMGQVEQAIADPERRTVPRNIVEAHAELGLRAIGAELDMHDGRAENLDRLLQGRRVEDQGLAIPPGWAGGKGGRDKRRPQRTGKKADARPGGQEGARLWLRLFLQGAGVDDEGLRLEVGARPGRLGDPAARSLA